MSAKEIPARTGGSDDSISQDDFDLILSPHIMKNTDSTLPLVLLVLPDMVALCPMSHTSAKTIRDEGGGEEKKEVVRERKKA
uniref:Uncharacterized protein n=1 Tax=Knipowitschia caucasica TaxID=637954 RepID=A0AAV2MIX5_KNICA